VCVQAVVLELDGLKKNPLIGDKARGASQLLERIQVRRVSDLKTGGRREHARGGMMRGASQLLERIQVRRVSDLKTGGRR